MTSLATHLGLSPTLAFQDVFSFDDPTLLSLVSRPAHALLVIIPMTPSWAARRSAEDDPKPAYVGSGPSEPVVWFKQTIGHACGLVGLLHCACNGRPAELITPGTVLDDILREAVPLQPAARANLLYHSTALEAAHQAHAQRGDTTAPMAEDPLDLHFVAYVKGKDGHLWELEGGGGRNGPLDRGLLGEGDDALSETALDLGVRSLLRAEREAGEKDLRFSCLALAPAREPEGTCI